MPALLNRIGFKYGRLTVLARAPNKGRYVMWACRCDCGRSVLVRGGDMASGRHKSCGCLQAESRTKHGHTRNDGYMSPEYNSWLSMKARCSNPKSVGYEHYGGRGITVCERWRYSFTTFLGDMGPRPSLAHTLDRIDHNGNYEPSNCRWADRVTQSRNSRHRQSGMPLEDIQAARAAHLNGESAESIASRLGVHVTTIHRLIAGKTWRNVS